MKESDRKNLPSLKELISLKGKKALITGSASGMGAAMAYRFAEAGADLELLDIDEEKLNKVKEDLRHFNTKSNVHKVNLSSKDEIEGF
jgi:NAD(P)-dependent dehydrogenase (short-subunit alcohol dehydrogenase family)